MVKNSLLRRFWFDTEKGLGVGVTAYDRNDAESIVRENQLAMSFRPNFQECVEDIDVQKLDQGHVIPNMGVVVDRGIWFPNL
tara:strand:+ start:4392 stop:4637 length:246 start_codon:yes stop_codon:yes gene_type:complete